ncbi:MAG: hypothetical protein IJJ69_00170 [Oscillospiraceae bacterium]|nr:hypothetical protein [Oscillospiraceae bacterium]
MKNENQGAVWWENVTKAKLLIDTVVNTLLSGRNIVLNLPQFVPWRDVFYEMIDDALIYQTPENQLVSVSCPKEQPGKYLLEHYCKREKRESYRCGMSYAEFLAKNPDIVLHRRYLWLQNLSQESVNEWVAFITEYNQYLEKDAPRAQFILEVSENVNIEKKNNLISEIQFNKIIKWFDVATFCMLLCTDEKMNDAVKSYLADLVASVCETDVELCTECISIGQKFLKNPVECLEQIIMTHTHNDGSPFELVFDTKVIERKIWKSQIKHLFPALESYRSSLVEKHYQEIDNVLPIQNNAGEDIDSPEAVELTSLVYLADRHDITLSEKEKKELRTCRQARNDLAHLRNVSWKNAEQIFNYKY